MISTQDIDRHVEAVILPVLDRHGAAIVARNYDDFYGCLTIEHRGEWLPLGVPVIDRKDPKALKLFLEHFDEIQAVVQRVMRITDPFYSDISVALDRLFRGRNPDERSLAFSYVCDKLRQAGKRIWTSD